MSTISFKKAKDKFPLKRLWDRVSVVGSCWIFNGATKHHAYGVIRYNGKKWPPGRLLKYKIDCKPLTRLTYACHVCDNPPCINPNHIFWGSPKDNTIDSVKKGRWTPRGGRNDHAVLTVALVKKFRKLNKEKGFGADKLSVMFGINRSTINNVLYDKDYWRRAV